jgi:hypothetical protein
MIRFSRFETWGLHFDSPQPMVTEELCERGPFNFCPFLPVEIGYFYNGAVHSKSGCEIKQVPLLITHPTVVARPSSHNTDLEAGRFHLSCRLFS